MSKAKGPKRVRENHREGPTSSKKARPATSPLKTTLGSSGIGSCVCICVYVVYLSTKSTVKRIIAGRYIVISVRSVVWVNCCVLLVLCGVFSIAGLVVKYRPTDLEGLIPGLEMDRVQVWVKESGSSAKDLDKVFIYHPEDDLYCISSISLGLLVHY